MGSDTCAWKKRGQEIWYSRLPSTFSGEESEKRPGRESCVSSKHHSVKSLHGGLPDAGRAYAYANEREDSDAEAARKMRLEVRKYSTELRLAMQAPMMDP